jgi:hypothetical protein
VLTLNFRRAELVEALSFLFHTVLLKQGQPFDTLRATVIL